MNIKIVQMNKNIVQMNKTMELNGIKINIIFLNSNKHEIYAIKIQLIIQHSKCHIGTQA